MSCQVPVGLSLPDIGRQLGASVVTIAFMSGCATAAPERPQGDLVRLSTSEGTSAELTVVDRSGFLVEAYSAPHNATSTNFQVAAAPEAPDLLIVSWISLPCRTTPTLTVAGKSLDGIEVMLERGPQSGPAECPAVGAQFSVALRFSGTVPPNSVHARITGD